MQGSYFGTEVGLWQHSVLSCFLPHTHKRRHPQGGNMEFPEHQQSGWFLSCREADFHQLFSMKWKARGCKGVRQKVTLGQNRTCVAGCKSEHEEWAARLHRVYRPGTYFPKAKHSSFTEDPLETRRVSGNCTSILGSYSPITAGWRIKDKAHQSKHTTWTDRVPKPHYGCNVVAA